MNKDGEGVVTPNQAWTEDGTAQVAPVAPFPQLAPRTLPLDHFPATAFTIHKTVFAQGVVCLPQGSGPAASPATLPIVTPPGDSVDIAEDGFVEWPDGFVVWFS